MLVLIASLVLNTHSTTFLNGGLAVLHPMAVASASCVDAHYIPENLSENL